jgi:hypothetical protein
MRKDIMALLICLTLLMVFAATVAFAFGDDRPDPDGFMPKVPLLGLLGDKWPGKLFLGEGRPDIGGFLRLGHVGPDGPDLM